MSKQQQLELIATLRQGQLDLLADVATLRVAFNDLMARIPVASDVAHVPKTIGDVNAVDVTIRGIDTANTILYFHGGVYVIGSAATSVPLVSDVARRAHANAVTVDYRLAPEHPYPAQGSDRRGAGHTRGHPRRPARVPRLCGGAG
jgi:epsilon-lactone hydrolase